MTDRGRPLRHPRKFPWGRALSIAGRTVLATGLALLVLLAVGVYRGTRQRFIVRNQSGAVLSDVQLRVEHPVDARIVLDEQIERIPDGESVQFRAWAPDSRAVLTFTIGGERRRHENGYIDLWAGEGWVFDVAADGSVVAGSSFTRGGR